MSIARFDKSRNPLRHVRYAPGADRFPTEGRSPAPRFDDKNPHNPPIVTIFGAGVAGLTAAHELVERGFLVQVIEKERDPYSKRPKVGGMAATQYGRVRANIEDLHPNLLTGLRALDGAGDPGAVLLRQATQWLLALFAHNRSVWIQTEVPANVHSALYSTPGVLTPAQEGEGQQVTIFDRLRTMLENARSRYRKRWLWDLVARPRNEPAAPEPSAAAIAQYLAFVAIDSTEQLAAAIARDSEFPLREAVLADARCRELIVSALEREFLAFRLIPFARTGVERGVGQARELLDEWENEFEATGSLRDCLQRWIPAGVQCDRERIPVRSGELPMSMPTDTDDSATEQWLELDIIEQHLPGEHGFRFFPSYYRHLDDTMKRIPLMDDRKQAHGAVIDNLRPTTVQGIGLSAEDIAGSDRMPPLRPDEGHSRVVPILRSRPRSVEGLRKRTDLFMRNLGGTSKDGAMFFARLMRFMTSCPQRREKYAARSWAEFIGLPVPRQRPNAAGDIHFPSPQNVVDQALFAFSPAMQEQLQAASQVLLAFSAAEADAHSYGNAATQLFMDVFEDGSRIDRTLNGPTTDAWLEPWREYLEYQGVRFFLGELTGLRPENGELVPEIQLAQTVSHDGYRLLAHDHEYAGSRPDFYVLALDLERSSDMIRPLPRDGERARDFAQLVAFGDVATYGAMKDMTGLQYFFEAKTSIGAGHLYYPYSEWGLSSISQSEFWAARGGFRDGYLGVLSVDIATTAGGPGSFWQQWPDALARIGEDGYGVADILARRKVAKETWRQLSPRIAADRLSNPRCFHLDWNVGWDFVEQEPINGTRYLAVLPEMWELRPGIGQRADNTSTAPLEHAINYDRWVLCGTHMATSTRMTTMEAANESGRRAARAILGQLERASEADELRGRYNAASPHRRYDLPDLFPLEENELEELKPLRDLDERLFKAGLPHFMSICDFDRRLALGFHLAEMHENDVRDALLANQDDKSSQRWRALALSLESLQNALGDALGVETRGAEKFKLGSAVNGAIRVLQQIAGVRYDTPAPAPAPQ